MQLISKRLLGGSVIVASFALGAFGASAESANGPDAGIGIPGYNLNYEHSADGSGPGYKRNNGAIQQPYPHYHHHNGQMNYRGY